MRIVAVLIALLVIFAGFSPQVFAVEYRQDYYQGIIVAVEEKEVHQIVSVSLTTGAEKGKQITIEQPIIGDTEEQNQQSYIAGDQVIISKIESDGRVEYFISDAYRNSALVWLGVVYALAIVILGQWKGVKSLLGLGVSFLVLTKGIIPFILQGYNPIMVTVIGSIIIMTASLYFTHGITRKTTVSLLGTLGSLIITSVLAHIMINAAKLSGLGTEEAMFLMVGETSKLNLQGLLLSGIIISALGVIDDITVTQTAIVYELKKTKPSLRIGDLYRKGLSIGKEHIASVTNTLILAYAGASLPLFLLFYQNTSVPFWVAMNSQLIAEEIVSTLVGSMGLVLCVPITTYLAAVVVSRKTGSSHT